MRIVYVLTSLGVGGAERQALGLADRMAQRGHCVAILALRPVVVDQWPTTLRVVHLGIRKSPSSVFAGLARGRRFLREFRPDLLHSHCFHANIFARLLKLLVPSIKVISNVHNVYEGGWHRMLAYRVTDSLARCTMVVSQAAGDHYVRLKATPARKCVVLPNGIEVREFTPNAERRFQMREEMAAENNFIWLASGRLVPAKDFPNLLRAFGLVHRVDPSARLWIAGAAPAAELQGVKHGDNSGGDFVGLGAGVRVADEQIYWLGLRRDMPALLDAADAFVQASAWEGMPLAVGEAMAMAKPVIATDAGGTREMVGETGTIVATKDSDALAAGMLDLMREHLERRCILGQAARTRIVEGFSMDARANEWETLYRSVADARD